MADDRPNPDPVLRREMELVLRKIIRAEKAVIWDERGQKRVNERNRKRYEMLGRLVRAIMKRGDADGKN